MPEAVWIRLPCLVFCRGLEPIPQMLDIAEKNGVPIFTTEMTTSDFIANSVRWLSEELAPRISIHGVLVDVYGEGVLIMGESGIGKSEAALELIHRGHRLVSDDVVEIRKISDDTLLGTSPDITRHFIELRGIGIVDVKTLFGVESVMYNHTVPFCWISSTKVTSISNCHFAISLTHCFSTSVALQYNFDHSLFLLCVYL